MNMTSCNYCFSTGFIVIRIRKFGIGPQLILFIEHPKFWHILAIWLRIYTLYGVGPKLCTALVSKIGNHQVWMGIYDMIILVMIIMLTCESVNRDTMTDLFSGSFNNLQLSMMEYLVKKKRKKRSLCQKRFRPFDQSVTRVWEVLNKVILGGRETTKGIFCTSGWGQQKLF